MTKLNLNQIRQGDVLFVRVGKRPPWAGDEAKRDQYGRLVAEYGEASGHAHAFRDPNVCGFRATSPEMAAFAGLDYIEVGGSTAIDLRHEYADGRHAEHATVAFSPGGWVRAVQVDEEAEVTRREAD